MSACDLENRGGRQDFPRTFILHLIQEQSVIGVPQFLRELKFWLDDEAIFHGEKRELVWGCA